MPTAPRRRGQWLPLGRPGWLRKRRCERGYSGGADAATVGGGRREALAGAAPGSRGLRKESRFDRAGAAVFLSRIYRAESRLGAPRARGAAAFRTRDATADK